MREGGAEGIASAVIRARFLPLAFGLVLAACNSGHHGAQVPGDANSNQPWHGIADGDVVRFVGTEPFWGGEARGDALTYTTPGKPEGSRIAIRRFAGRNGLSFSGTLDGHPFDLSVTPGACTDGMSDRHFPFVVTLLVGGETRRGCAWTDAQPFTGADRP